MPFVRFVLATLAVLLVNAVFSTGDFVEAPATALPSALGVELVVLIALLAVVSLRRPHAPGWLLWPLAALLLATAAVRALDTAIPWFFSRNFNLVVDARFIPFVWGLLASTMAPLRFAALVSGAALATLALVALLRAALGALPGAPAARDWRPFPAA